jgi:predicted transcriptional regulator
MSKSQEKLKALELRKQGQSIKDIAKLLNVSRGSVSLWCQRVILTDNQKRILKEKQISAGQRGRQMGADKNKTMRLDALEIARLYAENKVKSISTQELFFLGLGIYWGEGVKSRTSQAAVVNSDPRILRIMIKWFIDCLEIKKEEFRPYVYISFMHQNREQVIMNYWSKTLKLPLSQFKSPIYLHQKPKQKYVNHDSYFGVVALRVQKNTHLKYRILAMLEAINQRVE